MSNAFIASRRTFLRSPHAPVGPLIPCGLLETIQGMTTWELDDVGLAMVQAMEVAASEEKLQQHFVAGPAAW